MAFFRADWGIFSFLGVGNPVIVDDTTVLDNSLNLEKFCCGKELCGIKMLSSLTLCTCLIMHLEEFKKKPELYDKVIYLPLMLCDIKIDEICLLKI